MRKIVKKVATLAASVAMVAAMGISAFAADTYSMPGNACLFGDPAAADTWEPTNEDLFFEPVDGQDGLWVCEREYKANPDAKDDEIAQMTQFKVLADGDMLGWSYQMCLGIPESAWADNQTQFQIDQNSLKEGPFKVYMRPSDGMLAIIQDGQAVDYLVRYHSRDEDSWNYVEPTVAAITGDGYDAGSIKLTDEALKTFTNECVVLEGGTPAEDDATVEDDTTAADTDDATVEDDTEGSDETAATTAAKKEEKEEKDSTNYALYGGIAAAVVVIVIIAAVVLGKKKN